jgi:hypothetical protein
MQFSKERKFKPPKESEKDEKKTAISSKTICSTRLSFHVRLVKEFVSIVPILILSFYFRRGVYLQNYIYFLAVYANLAAFALLAFYLGQDDAATALKASVSWEQCLEMIRGNFDSLQRNRLNMSILQDQPKKVAFGNHKRERENFAAYVANPHSAFGTTLSSGEAIYKLLLICGNLILIPWILYPSALRPKTYETGYVTDRRVEVKEVLISVFFVLVCLFVVMLGCVVCVKCVKSLGWSRGMGYLARRMEESCLSSQVDKGDEGVRERLIWWVERLVVEESDSLEDAEERERKVVAPIVVSIKCY